MIGTPEKDTFKDPAPTSGVYEDFDVAYPAKSKVAPADDKRNLRKVQEKIKGIPLEVRLNVMMLIRSSTSREKARSYWCSISTTVGLDLIRVTDRSYRRY